MRFLVFLLILTIAVPAAAQSSTEILTAARRLDEVPTADAWRAAAAILARLGKWNAAADALEALDTKGETGWPASTARLLEARFALNANDLERAETLLNRFPQESQPASWLRAELALAKNDPQGAVHELEAASGSAATLNDVAVAEQLYCTPGISASAIVSHLRARAALGRFNADDALTEAKRSIAETAGFADAYLDLASALHLAGNHRAALDELSRLRSREFPLVNGCPPLRDDHLMFNAGNIAWDANDRRTALQDYEEAIRLAERHEADVRSVLKQVTILARSRFAALLESDPSIDSGKAAPEARNNLGQLLLTFAREQKNDRTSIERAKEQFIAAVANPLYRTKQYSYLGLAKAELAEGRTAAALEAAAEAVHVRPRYEDALDFLADLTRQNDDEVAARAGILLIESGNIALPSRYVRREYGGVLRDVADRLASGVSAAATQFLTVLDVFNGNYADAERRAAAAGRGDALWPVAMRAKIAAATGNVADANAAAQSLQQMLKSRRPDTPWEAATLRSAAATYSLLVSSTGKMKDMQRADFLVARFLDTGLDGGIVFPWQPAVFGVITDSNGQPVSGVLVTLKDSTGTKRMTVTGPSGLYEIAASQGQSEVEAFREGVRVASRKVSLGGYGEPLDFSLPMSMQSEVVTVAAQEMKLSPTSETPITVHFDDLPAALITNAVASLSLTAPLQISGSLRFVNTYNLDGVNVGDSAFRTNSVILTDLGQQATIALSGLPSEWRDTVIHLVTRSGTNDLKGTVQADKQAHELRAEPHDVVLPSAMREDRDVQTLHFNAGGRVLPEHLWLYAAGDIVHEGGRPTTTVQQGAARARSTHFFGKLTTKIGERDMEHIIFDRQSDGRHGLVDDVAGVVFGSPSSTTRDRTQTFGVASILASAVVTRNNFVEAHLSHQDESSSNRPATAAGDEPQVRDSANGFFTTGGVGYVNDERRFWRNSVGVTGTHTRAIKNVLHTMRAGIIYANERDQLRERLSGNAMVDRVEGSPDVIRYWSISTDAVPAAVVEEAFASSAAAIFAQDSVKLGRFTVDAGLRGDRQRVEFPGGQDLSTFVLQPRLGIAYDPYGDGRWRIATYVGRFADPLTRADRIAFGSTRRFVVKLPDQVLAYGRLAAVDPNLNGGAQDEMSFSAGRLFGQSTVMEVMASHRRLHAEIEDFFCTPDRQRCIGNPGRGIMRTLLSESSEVVESPVAHASVDRIQASLRRHAPPLEWEVVYWWTRSDGNVESPDLHSTHVVGFDPYVRTAFDLAEFVPAREPFSREYRHSLRAAGTLSRPHSAGRILTVGLSAAWHSGEPRARFGYSNLYGRYAYVLSSRGAESRSPSAYDADLRVVYDIPLAGMRFQLSGTLENVLNRQTSTVDDQRWNFAQIPLLLNPLFLHPMERSEPRTARLFARVEF